MGEEEENVQYFKNMSGNYYIAETKIFLINQNATTLKTVFYLFHISWANSP